jgi:hypothetical protein
VHTAYLSWGPEDPHGNQKKKTTNGQGDWMGHSTNELFGLVSVRFVSRDLVTDVIMSSSRVYGVQAVVINTLILVFSQMPQPGGWAGYRL